MTQRLPTVGGDSGNWGTILNGYLSVSLNADGTVNSGVIADSQVVSGANINPSKINGTAEVQSNKGNPNGYASLDGIGKLPIGQLTSITTANVPSSSDARYVTDAQSTILGNTSGTNSGDQTKFTFAVASVAGSTTGNLLTLTSAQTQNIGDAVMINSSGNANLAKADVIADASTVLLAAANVSGSASNTYLLPGGTLRLAASPSWTIGGQIYLSITGTTGNTLTQTEPSATNNVIQILGVALSGDTILFLPSLVQIEHA